MRLTELLSDPGVKLTGGEFADVCIRGLTADSRRVEPGYLFAALPGSRADGSLFIGDALRRGAVAVLAPPGDTGSTIVQTGSSVPVLIDENPRRRFALLAARFFASQPAVVAAVTGTNGKSSVVSFLRQIWAHLGQKAASLGTLGVETGDRVEKGSHTTPDPVSLHATLARLAEEGIDALAMEASSHGLAQYRLDGVRLKVAAFTNLSRDHLDYHGSFAAYLAAKLRLFSDLVEDGGSIVVNADAADAAAVIAVAARRHVRLFTVGTAGRDLTLMGSSPIPGGQRLSLGCDGKAFEIDLPLVGDFQASNVLVAAGMAITTGHAAADVIEALGHLQPVRGRLEHVVMLHGSADVFVDYAHTPDALASCLAALRPIAKGRLWVVFGCGGDRDTGKRPEMGRIAAERADIVIVTDDNPRSEVPAAIRAEVMVGCPEATQIGDRTEAIAFALRGLAAGDVLVVAGKGHETGQIIGSTVLPFDDAEVIRTLAREIGQ